MNSETNEYVQNKLYTCPLGGSKIKKIFQKLGNKIYMLLSWPNKQFLIHLNCLNLMISSFKTFVH